jgi:chemotaxis protein methyltransferase CheR
MQPRSYITRTAKVTDEEYLLFRSLIYKESGIDLKECKRSLLMSRLSRRLRELELPTLKDYYQRLMANDPGKEELRRMINCVTTNMTSFFREKHHFAYLENWFRGRLRERGNAGRFHVWCTAASTGEEPYSIAISLLEALGGRAGWDVSIVASDIDTDVLATAAQGIYEEKGLGEIDQPLRRKYFLRGTGELSGRVQVKPAVRRLVEFRQVNLISPQWPFRGKFDAVFCRNVVIYFDRPTQEVLFERLLDHLEPEGRLFVGHSESLTWLGGLVTQDGQTVYRHGPAAPQVSR